MNNDTPATDFPNNWREMWTEMQREWDRLHKENAELRSERDQLSKALIALMDEEIEIEFSREEILAQLGREKPFREFLKEMRAQLAEN